MNKLSFRVTNIVIRTSVVLLWVAGWVHPCLGEAVNSSDRSPDDVKKLLCVGNSRRSEILSVSEDGLASASYGVAGLEPSSSYEIRISFTSTMSVQMHFRLLCESPETNKDQDGLEFDKSSTIGSTERMKISRRRLLHAEKIMFATDDHGNVLVPSQDADEATVSCPQENMVLNFGVSQWAQMLHQTGSEGRYFYYDIILERNYLGIPESGIPLIGMTVLLVLFVCGWGARMWVNKVQTWWLQEMISTNSETHEE